jgi:crotonobetainyl-CoA:carnitine CoA-transferase CaiB-like acyl-CoA transferase
MVREIEHPVAGVLKTLRNPIRLSETPINDYAPPPLVGQHTDQILAAAGYAPEDIETLRQAGVV